MEADNVQPGSPSGSSGSSIDFLPATPTQGHYYGYHPTKAPWMHVPYNIPGVQPQTYVTQQPQALVVSQPYVASQPRSYVVKSRPPPPPPGSKKSLVIPAPLGQWDKPQAKGLKYRKLGASNQYSMYTTDGFPLAVQIANKVGTCDFNRRLRLIPGKPACMPTHLSLIALTIKQWACRFSSPQECVFFDAPALAEYSQCLGHVHLLDEGVTSMPGRCIFCGAYRTHTGQSVFLFCCGYLLLPTKEKETFVSQRLRLEVLTIQQTIA